jgi:hypothetical protein
VQSFRAKGAIHAALNHLAVSIRSATTVQVGAEDREVKVDGYGRKDQPSESGKVEVKIQLAGLNDYEASSSQGVWEKFTKVRRTFFPSWNVTEELMTGLID